MHPKKLRLAKKATPVAYFNQIFDRRSDSVDFVIGWFREGSGRSTRVGAEQ